MHRDRMTLCQQIKSRYQRYRCFASVTHISPRFAESSLHRSLIYSLIYELPSRKLRNAASFYPTRNDEGYLVEDKFLLTNTNFII